MLSRTKKRSIEMSTSIDRYYDSVNDRFEFKDQYFRWYILYDNSY